MPFKPLWKNLGIENFPDLSDQNRDARWGTSPSFIDAQVIYRRAFGQISNLGHVEKKIGFSRGVCEFWKHAKKGEWTADEVNNAALQSLDNLVADQDCPDCPTCGGVQDIAAYCLEDAISALLIYMSCVNQLETAREQHIAHERVVRRVYHPPARARKKNLDSFVID